jgi:phytanoyl-CoA hydroxylase
MKKVLDDNSKFYNTNGWVIEKDIFNKKEINELKLSIKNYLKKNIDKYKGREINFYNKKKHVSNINSFHKLEDVPAIKKLLLNTKINFIAKKYINSKKIKLRACELFAKPAKKGLAAPIHQDNYYWCLKKGNAITIWVALDKANSRNGGVFYFNQSHKNGLMKHAPSYQKGSSQKIYDLQKLKKYTKVTPKLSAGDCLIHHCLVVHGSNKNLSTNPRMGFTFQFKDYTDSHDLQMKKNYEKSLYKQIESRL